MERYLMVLVANRISNETTYSDLQQFLEGGFCTQKDDDCNNSSCVLDRHRTHYISIVFPDAQHSQLAEWRVITQSSDVQCVELLKEFNTDDVTSEIDSKYLDDTLHGLADKLPVTGSFLLDVVWIFDASYFPIHEHLYLFGSLRRLQEWHNANITVLCTSDSQTAITSWVSYLNATCRLLQDAHINDMCLCTRRDVVWKGTVTLHESKGVNSVAIPGFVLTRCSEEMDKHDSKFRIILREEKGSSLDE
ncbi:mdm2-binding protein-like, partial [Saccoglossus kowalevskii]|uniref:Uncharacterized protein LOC100367789 n=1 Tax=Saccoglossus kowalevskii TaxID=10224 RepID=A0ABM0GZU5_SACKO